MLNNNPPYDTTNSRTVNCPNTVKNTAARNYHHTEKLLQSKTDLHNLKDNSNLSSENRPTYGAYNTRNALPRGPYIQYKINNQQTQLDQKPSIYHSQQHLDHQLYHQQQYSSDQDNKHKIELPKIEFISLPRSNDTPLQSSVSRECLQKKRSIFGWPDDGVNTLGRRVPLKSDNSMGFTNFDHLPTISSKNEHSIEDSYSKYVHNKTSGHYNNRHSSPTCENVVSSSFLKQIQTQNFDMVRDIRNRNKLALATTSTKCSCCNTSSCVCTSKADVKNREYFTKKANLNTNYVTLRAIINRKDSARLSQSEGWALLCQSVQALQDLFLADTPSPTRILPLVNADSLRITSRGRVVYKLNTTDQLDNWHDVQLVDSLRASLSPEFLQNCNNKISFTESDTEKMWIYSLGVTLREIIPYFTADDEAEQRDCVTHSDNAANADYSITRQTSIAKRETINEKRNGKNCDKEYCIKGNATTKTPASMTRINNNYNYYINMNDGCRNIADVTDTSTSILTSLSHTIISMCDPNINYRASLMYLLNVISEHCRGHHQIKPFSHIVMDLFKEAAIIVSTLNSLSYKNTLDELNSSGLSHRETYEIDTKLSPPDLLKVTRRTVPLKEIPVAIQVPIHCTNAEIKCSVSPHSEIVPSRLHRKDVILKKRNNHRRNTIAVNAIERTKEEPEILTTFVKSNNNIDSAGSIFDIPNFNNRSMPELNAIKFATLPNLKVRRRRRVLSIEMCEDLKNVDIKTRGPEFIVNSSLLTEPIDITELKCHQHCRRTVSVLLLNGRNIRIICNPQSTTAQQIFETVVRSEGFKNNFFLGLCALIGGDFVFLPADLKIYKVAPQIWFSSYRKTNFSDNVIFTLFLRIKFFLPSLRGINSPESQHLHYLQLRKSILESQILCSNDDLISLGGLALQSEVGDYDKTMQIMDYFTISHYLPEGVYQKNTEMGNLLRNAHFSKRGLHRYDVEKSFVNYVQKMNEYGLHLYSAVWTTEDQASQDVYVSISLSGIGLFQRSSRAHCDQQNSLGRSYKKTPRNLLAQFDWLEIENLCFSKHVLCVVVRKAQSLKAKDNNRFKYKLKMDERKSYFAFTLASEHHKFYMKLRHCYVSVKELSQDMNMPLSTNNFTKNDGLTVKSKNIEINQTDYDGLPLTAKNIKKLDKQNVKISTANRMRNITKSMLNDNKLLKIKNSILKRSKSSPGIRNDVLSIESNSVEEFQNKENELPNKERILGFSSVAQQDSVKLVSPNRNRVKMGTRAFSAHFLNKSYDNIYDRSIDAMSFEECIDNAEKNQSRQLINADGDNNLDTSDDELTGSSHSSEKHSAKLLEGYKTSDAYVIHSSIASIDGRTNYLSILQQDESVSNTLLDNLNNLSGYNSASDRIIAKLTIKKDTGDKMNFSSKNEYARQKLSEAESIKQNDEGGLTLGISIVQGSDNNVYVKDLVRHGPGELSGVQIGDQILAVNGVTLLTLPYRESLQILQRTGKIVELLVSQLQPSVRSQHFSKAEKDLSVESSEQCRRRKQHQRNYLKSVDYLKHIRYETDDINQIDSTETKFIQLEDDSRSRSNVLMATKSMLDLPKVIATLPISFNELSGNKVKAATAMPRAMGLSRRYVGPVKYPVTPIRVSMGTEKQRLSLLVDEEDKQVFI